MSNMSQLPPAPSTNEGDAFLNEEKGPFGGINLTPALPLGPEGVSYPQQGLQEPLQSHQQSPLQAFPPASNRLIQPLSPAYLAPQSIPRYNRGKGAQLSDFERLELLKICVGNLTVLKNETKTAFYRRVSARFESQLGRPYSPQSCERQVNHMTDLRREYLTNHITGNAEGEHTESTAFLDEIIAAQDEISENARERSEQVALQQKESQQDIEHRQFLAQGLSQPRKRRISRSQSSHRSSSPSSAASFDPDQILISTLSKISEAVDKDDSVSQRIKGLEDQYKHLQETVSESQKTLEKTQSSLDRHEGILNAILGHLEQINRTRN